MTRSRDRLFGGLATAAIVMVGITVTGTCWTKYLWLK